jgi:hypothetical protein
VYLISTKGARQLWPVSRGCLLVRGTWFYLCICQRSVLPYTRFWNCLLDYDYVLHIVNFAILYLWKVILSTRRQFISTVNAPNLLDFSYLKTHLWFLKNWKHVNEHDLLQLHICNYYIHSIQNFASNISPYCQQAYWLASWRHNTT